MSDSFTFRTVLVPGSGNVAFQWQWERHDGSGETLGRSEAAFKTLADCIADAKEHGFDETALPAGRQISDLIQLPF